MTEAEWLACDDPETMLAVVREPGRYRKLLLFAIACLDHMAEITGFSDAQRARILNLAEARAEGDFVDPEPHITLTVVASMRRSPGERIYLDLLVTPRQFNVVPIAQHAVEKITTCPFPRRRLTYTAERATQAALLREIVGHPFRTAVCDSAWLTSDVLLLANGIYEGKAFDRMPILADALQDAGCENTDILDHCRGPGPHVCGCWVVDLLLDKK
jgi:hypothetical protein